MLEASLRRHPEVLWARRLTWAYFWLLIFEGALRKWLLPELSNPLILIRDPLVLLIYLLVASGGQFPRNGFILFSLALALLLGITAMVFGHGDLWVTLYGLRTNFLHLPLIFVIPQIFSLNDVQRFGRAVMWVSLPMAGLIVWQFLSPPGSRLNIAVGGTFSQLVGAMGHVRPSGTFSFVTGVTSFLSLQLAFIISAFMQRQDRWLRSFSLLALILGLVCSISRASWVACAAVLAAALWAVFLNPPQAKRGLLFFGLLLALAAAASLTPVFQYGQRVMSARLTDVEQVTGTQNIFSRILNDLTDPFHTLASVSLAGAGTGAGTNVGAQLLVGQRGFLLAELEWSRLMLESGLILGLALIGLRITLAGYLVVWAWRTLRRTSHWMPWLICASIFPWVFNGPWGQPTMLGFACWGAGLVLAATRPSFAPHTLFSQAARARPS